MIASYTRLVSKHPKWAMLGLFLVVAYFGYEARNSIIDNDLRKLVFQGSRDVAFLDHHNEVFGPDDTALLLILTPQSDTATKNRDGFTALIETLGDRLLEIDGVIRVDSLTHTDVIQSIGDELVITPLFGSRSRINASFDERLTKLNQSTSGRLLSSQNHESFLVVAEFDHEFKDVKNILKPGNAASDLAREVIAESGLEVQLDLAGIPYTRIGTVESILRDLLVLFPAISIVVGILLWFLFRRMHVVILPLTGISCTCIITMGIAALLGEPITPLSSIFPVLILVIGIGDALHFLGRFHEERLGGYAYEEAIVRTGASVGKACVLTSITSATGFLSLFLTDMEILYNFGLLNAIGLMVAFTVILTLLPAGLAFVKSPPVSMSPKVATGLSGIVRWLTSPARAIVFVVVGVLICIYGVYASQNVHVDYVASKLLGDHHEVTRGNVMMDKKFFGILNIDVNLQGDENSFKKPEVLKAMSTALQHLEKEFDVQQAVGISSIVRDLNQELRNEDAIPDEQSTIAQLLLLAEGDADAILERFVTTEMDEARLTFSIQDHGGSNTVALARKIMPYLEGVFSKVGVEARITGIQIVAAEGFVALISRLIESLLTALLFIVLFVGLIFRNLRIAIASILPNVLPLLAVLSIFGLTQTSLGLLPAVMFCIAIGVAVDDTIHLMTRYQEEMNSGIDSTEAIVRSVTHSLLTVVNTSIILILGFMVLLFSGFPENRTAGLLGALIIVVALLADLVFVPVVLALLKPKGSSPAA